jgi:hypothetical protein
MIVKLILFLLFLIQMIFLLKFPFSILIILFNVSKQFSVFAAGNKSLEKADRIFQSRNCLVNVCNKLQTFYNRVLKYLCIIVLSWIKSSSENVIGIMFYFQAQFSQNIKYRWSLKTKQIAHKRGGILSTTNFLMVRIEY